MRPSGTDARIYHKLKGFLTEGFNNEELLLLPLGAAAARGIFIMLVGASGSRRKPPAVSDGRDGHSRGPAAPRASTFARGAHGGGGRYNPFPGRVG